MADAQPAFLVIPVKPFAGAKQRLASRLPDGARRLLSRVLATHVVACAAQAWPRSRLLVVGDDPQTEELCRKLGLSRIGDPGAGQSAAVRLGQAWSRERGARTLVTIPADLPWLETADVEELGRLAGRRPERSLLAFPDAQGEGTNGLVVRPAEADVCHFGPGSLGRHREAAADLGLTFEVCHQEHLAWDLDRFQDLDPQGAGPGHPVLAWTREVAELVAAGRGGAGGR